MSTFEERSAYLRKHVVLHADHVSSVTSSEYPGTHPGEDLEWNLDSFKDNFKLVITKIDGDNLEFDMIGVDAAVANAFRRILIAEVPTMAIERVYSLQNTSIVQDEILAQRLGLVPIAADPREFEWGGCTRNDGRPAFTSSKTHARFARNDRTRPDPILHRTQRTNNHNLPPRRLLHPQPRRPSKRNRPARKIPALLGLLPRLDLRPRTEFNETIQTSERRHSPS